MPVKKGTNSISKVYKGTDTITRIYKGEYKVYESTIRALYFSPVGGAATVSMYMPETLFLNIEYSTDGSTWVSWDGSSLNCPVYIRGRNNSRISSLRYKARIGGTGFFKCSGNIMHLLDCTQDLTTIPSTYCFAALFLNATSLVSVPDLPATTLTDYCYQDMFAGCSNLNVSENSGGASFFTCPSTAGITDAVNNMFSRTGGSFTGTPTDGNSYYYNNIRALHFTSSDGNAATVALTNTGSNAPTLEYSTDGSTWTSWDYSALSCPVYIRGNNPSGLSSSSSVYSTFTITGNVDCTGNIMHLLDYTQDLTTIPSAGCFYYMFSGCTSLTTAPALPATTLAEFCYSGMFINCTSLSSAPALPATTLANDCYYYMFYGCTSLTTAPALPATTLAASCYYDMFKGCTSLASAPALPATTLAASCYYDMFKGCTSLTSAPSLPASTLAEFCYVWMFKGCTSLASAPALPATTLANDCYYYMFCGCTSLTTAPALPATTLAEACYSGMFNGCTSLASAPALPATTLAKACYSGMFNGCTSLASAPALSATTLAASCYYDMFKGCTSLTSTPSLPASTLAKSCYYDMFKGCTSLASAPSLPATTLTNYCYYAMFSGCSNLNISESSGGTQIFTCPSTTGITNPVTNMFDSTAGSFTGTPTTGNTYYYN